MRKFILILAVLLFFSGCSGKKVSEKEFKDIWKEYIKTEFEESFDEAQSDFQREQILKKII